MHTASLPLVALAALCAFAQGCVQPLRSEDAARLQRLEDREQIIELMTAYGATLDRRDFTAFAQLFAEDAEYGSGPGAARGRAAIRAQLERVIGSNPSSLPAPNSHLFFNPTINITGDTATARSLGAYTAPDSATGSTRMVFFVAYQDTLVRREGRWLFLRRVTGSSGGPDASR
jgi:uncharacterized protein (TIGR02246 family)